VYHPILRNGLLRSSSFNKLILYLFLLIPSFFHAQQSTPKEPSALYDSVSLAIQSQNLNEFMTLASDDSEERKELQTFFENFQNFRASRIVIKLADEKNDLMILHVLLQREDESAFQSWSLSLSNQGNTKRIRHAVVLSSVDGLYQLKLSPNAVPVHNIEINHFDAAFLLQDGVVFPILAGGKLSGAVFLGKANFIFKPSDAREQQQLVLFNKKPKIQTSMSELFLRSSSNTLRSMFGSMDLLTGNTNSDLYGKALEISQQGNLNAFGVRLPFGDELWFPRLMGPDVYSELKTQAGEFVYQFAPKETEDILLLDRQNGHIISLYSSTGVYSSAPEVSEFEILEYKMNLNYNPAATYLSGVAEIRLKCAEVSTSIVFKLNPTLRVTRIDGTQGSLIYFQERNTNNLHVVMSEVPDVNSEITLRFHYQGKIEPDMGRAEVQKISRTEKKDNDYFIPPSYLYSNSAQWYPQMITRPYSPLKITISVPSDYAAISNGELKTTEEFQGRTVYTYNCEQPLKYFSLLIGRISSSISYKSIVPMNIFFYSLDRDNAQEQAELADRILRFYENYFGSYPYSSLNVVLRPAAEPGGHAPGTFVIANRVFTFLQSKVGKDPLHLPEFPEFFLAHEVAHQWWGQAVGWKSYRDQWLSEGFAHFAAAEYVRSVRGDEAWLKLSRIFYAWVENKTKAGPIWLGSRLGHLTQDPQAFSALLYNKGAYILFMLKELMGPEDFAACLKDFFQKYKHTKASIEDFRTVAQKHYSGDLNPFFDQWLSRWDIPEVKWNYSVHQDGSDAVINLRFKQSAALPYLLKLPLVARDSAGKEFRTDVTLDKPAQNIELHVPLTPVRVELDPLRENLVKVSQ
jgi:hypothetical protein